MTPVMFCIEINKFLSCKQRTYRSQNNFRGKKKKKLCWRIILSDFNIFCKATVIEQYGIDMKVLVTQSYLPLCSPLACSSPAPLSMGFARQEYFLTQGSNLGLLHWRQILYHLSHQLQGWQIDQRNRIKMCLYSYSVFDKLLRQLDGEKQILSTMIQIHMNI